MGEAYLGWFLLFVFRKKKLSGVWYRYGKPKVYRLLLDETGSVEYVIAELTRTGLIYEYMLNGQWLHDHFFAGVLLNAYNEADVFELPQEVEHQYSQQELQMIRKAIEKGKVG